MEARPTLHRVLAVAAMAASLAGVGARPAAALRPAYVAGGPIEAAYATAPATPVTWDDGRPDGCGSAAPPTQAYTFVFPASVGADGVRHPVVVWGNGTSADPAAEVTCSYEPWLRHLAQRGFVVVAPNSGQVGSGTRLRDAANLLVLDNLNPLSRFFQKLDPNAIAVAGHSQGAVGAFNAVVDNPNLFDAALSVGIPNRDALQYYNAFLCGPPNCVDVTPPTRAEMDAVTLPVFFARTTANHLTDVCRADDWISNQTAAHWYPRSPGAWFAAGTVKVDRPADDTECRTLFGFYPWPHLHTENVTGYGAAWLHYVTGFAKPYPPADPPARPAFAGPNPEILPNPNWTGETLTGNLP